MWSNNLQIIIARAKPKKKAIENPTFFTKNTNLLHSTKNKNYFPDAVKNGQ
jgi:hypothetical protein